MGIRKRVPGVTAKQAASAAIRMTCDLWEWKEEGRPRPKRPLGVYLQAVMKHVQELESGRKAIPQFELAGVLLDDAVEGAIAYLDK